jgi:hypothetical protein
VDSGMATLNFFLESTKTELFSFFQGSDDALYTIFKK